MKKAIFFIISIFVVSNLFAQNNGFNYKALIANNGSVLNAQSVNIKFTILENGTTQVFQETQSATTDANGIVSVNIGEGTVVLGNFTAINWGDAPHFLKVEINTGNGYQDYGTTEFKYVPYAKYAESAEVADYVVNTFWRQNSNGINSSDRVGIGRPVSVEANLHIKDITGGDALIKMESADNVYTIWQSSRAGADDYLVGIDGGNNNFQISNITTGAHPFTIKADKVGINNINPSANLDVVGNMSLVDGTQANGKVLTSDANGMASWQAIPDQSDADFYAVGTTTPPTSINAEMYHLGIVGLGTDNPNSNDILTVKNISTNNNGHAAIHASMQGSGSGFHYGIYNTVGGTGTGAQYGLYTIINNSGNANHYANYSEITGNGAGFHVGNYIRISGTGDGVHYGSYSYLTGTGIGAKYGSRNIITPTAGGAHYAVYGEATKNANNVYAGYFVGDVQINQGKLLGEDSGDTDMKAYIYGQIQTSATTAGINTSYSSAGFTVHKLAGTGKFRISFTDTTLANYIVVANRFYYPGFVTYRRYTGYFDIYVYDTSGSFIDSSFTFVVYKK